MIDVTKPMRLRIQDTVREATLVALFGSERDADNYRARMGLGFSRQPGQLMLIALDGEPYGWFSSDGVYNRTWASGAFLENYEPPVVVKARRGVNFHPNRQGDSAVTTGSPSYAGSNRLGTIEFTVTDGKLTDVEIVE